MEQNTIEKQDAFLRDLRQQTAESHKTLETNPLSSTLLSSEVSTSTYQQYLSKLFVVVRACEEQVFPMLTHLFSDLAKREKSCLIFNDLAFCGMARGHIAAIPVHNFYLLTIPQALGIMYVLEGSTLGGRILYKHMQETLGLSHEKGASYFWSYGTETGIMWKIFLSAFSRVAVEKNWQEEIIESARMTFQLLDNLLTVTEVPHNEH